MVDLFVQMAIPSIRDANSILMLPNAGCICSVRHPSWLELHQAIPLESLWLGCIHIHSSSSKSSPAKLDDVRCLPLGIDSSSGASHPPNNHFLRIVGDPTCTDPTPKHAKTLTGWNAGDFQCPLKILTPCSCTLVYNHHEVNIRWSV